VQLLVSYKQGNQHRDFTYGKDPSKTFKYIF
jgi:hypothetical protein